MCSKGEQLADGLFWVSLATVSKKIWDYFHWCSSSKRNMCLLQQIELVCISVSIYTSIGWKHLILIYTITLNLPPLCSASLSYILPHWKDTAPLSYMKYQHSSSLFCLQGQGCGMFSFPAHPAVCSHQTLRHQKFANCNQYPDRGTYSSCRPGPSGLWKMCVVVFCCGAWWGPNVDVFFI